MIRKVFSLLALALAAAAVAAPLAQASSTPKVDPHAVSYLMGKGLSPSEVTSWTVGACSHQVKAASCYAMLDRSAPAAASTPKVDPLAASYLMGRGLSPAEVTSWTVGACSQQVKAASCYAMLDRTAAPAPSSQPVASSGFHWVDAGIGAGATLGIVLLIGGLGAGLISRQTRRHQTARA